MEPQEIEIAQAKNAKRGGMLNALTSLRFFAAFLVFLWHITYFTGPGPAYLFQVGYIGVGFFYLLSGFILTYVYFEKLKRKSTQEIKKFYIARIAKIYPIHFLTMVASIPLVLMSAQYVFPDFTSWNLILAGVANLTLTQSWIPFNTINFSFNGVAWSISDEMFFYALFPLLILLIAKLKPLLRARNTLLLAIGIWIVLLFVFMSQSSSIDDWKLYIFPVARIPDFMIGILIGVLYLNTRNSKALKEFKRKTNFTWLEAGSLVLIVAAIGLSIFMPQSIRFSLWLIPFWSIIIFVFAQERGRITKFLAKKPLVFLGEISFSFYMSHQLVQRYVDLLKLTPVASVVLSGVITIAISSLLFLIIEEPARVRLKQWLEKALIRRKTKA